MALPKHKLSRLLDEVAYDTTERWNPSLLRMDAAAFSELITQLQWMEDSGEIEILSISRENTDGSMRATAVSFIRRR